MERYQLKPLRGPEEVSAYTRGFTRGARGAWPLHKPPYPPEAIVRAMMAAAAELRDAVDTACAQFDPKDDFVTEVAPKIDALDASMSALTEWLLTRP